MHMTAVLTCAKRRRSGTYLSSSKAAKEQTRLSGHEKQEATAVGKRWAHQRIL